MTDGPAPPLVSTEDSTDTPAETNYFDRVPLWSATGKRFEVMADAVSGRIPVTRLESWRDFAGLLEDPFFNRPGVELVFRGQRRHDWGLMPSLARLTSDGIITRELAEQQLARFKRAVRGRLPDRSMVDEDDEIWSVGQHHGLQTPLLDWSYAPYVALFFAFAQEDPRDEAREEKAGDNQYRAVFVLNKTFVADDDACPDIRVCEPRKDDYGRLVNQAGLFIVPPYDATIENKLADILGSDEFEESELREADEDAQPEILARYICKIYIRNEDRDACLRQLRRMNVHHANLFPDLAGASDYCNIAAAEEQMAKEIHADVPALVPVLTSKSDGATEHAEMAPGDASYPDPATRRATGILVVRETAARYGAEIQRDWGASGFVRELLLAPAAARDVEPGRIARIAKELAREIELNMVVDWDSRESVQAKMRGIARAALRRNGYPIEAREEVVHNLIERITGTGGLDTGTNPAHESTAPT